MDMPLKMPVERRIRPIRTAPGHLFLVADAAETPLDLHVVARRAAASVEIAAAAATDTRGMTSSAAQTSPGDSEGRLRLGYSLSCEEHRAEDLVRFAQRAEQAGFEYASISDHFHPWIDEQGNSPFVWSVLGAIANATSTLMVGTGVTCPTMRYHPAIVAQAAATVASLMPGRFFLGVGTGENLNEHVVGARWPRYETRAEMLEEAIALIRELWRGETVDWDGEYFTAENARLYTLPDEPPPIVVAAGGPKAAALAGRIGDGLINYTADASVVDGFRASGRPDRPRYLQMNVCWAKDQAEAKKTAHRICPNVALTGELGNQLPTPTHYQQAVQILTEDDVAEIILCDPDPEAHLAKIREGFDAGYDNIHVYQVGSDQEGFFRFYESEILPRL
jgi:coenzyme F420-dependent glucose-6-phosphate dehydrogenase